MEIEHRELFPCLCGSLEIISILAWKFTNKFLPWMDPFYSIPNGNGKWKFHSEWQWKMEKGGEWSIYGENGKWPCHFEEP